jgi:riboflavin biosynthesis pyrimidine reductase
MEPLRTLLEDPPARNQLPGELGELYGGLDLAADLVYANFISSLDGVVTLGLPGSPGPVLRGEDEADGLVMGLLRVHADALVIGAGTLRAERGHEWSAAYVDPRRRDAYRALGRPDPRLVVVTARGELDPSQPGLQAGALVLTTDAGAARLSGRLPGGCRIRALGAAPGASDIVAAVRAEGHRRILCEGGPTLLGRMADERVLDELFLTLSPVLAGRRQGDGRLGLVQGVHFLPERGRWGRLHSLRAHGSHLFVRYAFDAVDSSSARQLV